MASAGISGTPIADIIPCHACCCFIEGLDCNPATCIGCSAEGQFCCCMGSFKGCKPVGEENSDRKCCVCWEGGEYCITPNTCCQGKQQFFCLDARCALPCTDEVPCMFTCLPFCVVFPAFGCCKSVGTLLPDLKVNDAEKPTQEKPQQDVTDVPAADLRPCQACCCTITSLYCDCPDCLGCKGEGMLCCIQQEFTACKPISGENTAGICCVCFEGGYYCVMPSTCCLMQEQFFCLDHRCALPCTSDKVPILCTCLPFCVLYPGFSCCGQVGDVYPDLKSQVTPMQQGMDDNTMVAISKDGRTRLIKALRDEYADNQGPKVGELMDGTALNAADKQLILAKLGGWEDAVRGASNKGEKINEIAAEIGCLS